MVTDTTHLLSLFENATEGIIIINNQGKIVLINPAAERMFGYHASELIGQKIEILVPNRFRPNHEHLRENFHSAPSNRIMGQNRDLSALRKDSSDLPVEISLSHYKKDGETFVMAFVIDITKRKEIEANMLKQRIELQKISMEIRKLNTELEAKVEERTLILKEALHRLEQSQKELRDSLDKERQLNEIKGRFVSMASHEFRTPLSTVLSSATLLSKYKLTEDQGRRDKHIDKIKSSVKHLNDILEDFLNLGKLDEGKVLSFEAPVEINEFIIETTEEMKGLLKSGQFISYHHNGENKVVSDKKLLKNILFNLITNAIKFSDENSEIEIMSDRDECFCRIIVKDHGIGISDEDQDHLFSSFFRGANATNIQGTGLGLHIVKRYVDLLGGSIILQSQLNEGTTITISIPVNKEQHEDSLSYR
ncbi:MAG: PAS domain-containing sensor histidine kinase [Chitinophagaceae bacterium]|nr:PAS domain-containing sensor histidine kinase [Chitinophagaceae bacterium]